MADEPDVVAVTPRSWFTQFSLRLPKRRDDIPGSRSCPSPTANRQASRTVSTPLDNSPRGTLAARARVLAGATYWVWPRQSVRS